MAALRIAARRLVGGGGQTPAAAVGEAQRRLLPRLFRIDRARSTTSSAAAADSNAAAAKGFDADGRERLLKEIHNRREQLYDLTSEAETMYHIPGRAGEEVSRLRQELAAQIKPRSDDIIWRLLRGKSKIERNGAYAAVLFTTYVLTSMYRGAIVELEPEERQWLKTKRKEASKGRSGDNVSLK